jgi:hypothetical protein
MQGTGPQPICTGPSRAGKRLSGRRKLAQKPWSLANRRCPGVPQRLRKRLLRLGARDAVLPVDHTERHPADAQPGGQILVRAHRVAVAAVLEPGSCRTWPPARRGSGLPGRPGSTGRAGRSGIRPRSRHGARDRPGHERTERCRCSTTGRRRHSRCPRAFGSSCPRVRLLRQADQQAHTGRMFRQWRPPAPHWSAALVMDR